MQALVGVLAALALAQPSVDPRAIDPAANRPEIVAPGGSPSEAKMPRTRPAKVQRDPKQRDPKQPDRKQLEPKERDPKEPDPKEPDPKEPDPKEPDPKEPDPKEPDPKQPPETIEDTGPTAACFPEHGRCWRLNIAGITAASVGVGALAIGVGFIKAPVFPGQSEPNEPIFDRSLRPPGVVLVALGAITVVTGVLMIVAGHASHGKPQRNRSTARVQLVPGGLRW